MPVLVANGHKRTAGALVQLVVDFVAPTGGVKAVAGFLEGNLPVGLHYWLGC